MKEPANLASLILAKEVFAHFEIVTTEIVATQANEQEIHLYLEQKNNPQGKS